MKPTTQNAPHLSADQEEHLRRWKICTLKRADKILIKIFGPDLGFERRGRLNDERYSEMQQKRRDENAFNDLSNYHDRETQTDSGFKAVANTDPVKLDSFLSTLGDEGYVLTSAHRTDSHECVNILQFERQPEEGPALTAVAMPEQAEYVLMNRWFNLMAVWCNPKNMADGRPDTINCKLSRKPTGMRVRRLFMTDINSYALR